MARARRGDAGKNVRILPEVPGSCVSGRRTRDSLRSTRHSRGTALLQETAELKDVALVGAGYWGRNLARVLSELGRLCAICDPSESAHELATRYGVPYLESLEAALEIDELGALVIATPATTHYELARCGLEAGLDIFVEKPMALEAADAEQLCKLSREGKRVLMVGHLLQYHPAYQKLWELVDNGDLGRLQYLYSHRLNFGKIRTEENILWSFAPHDISMILGLAREMPDEIDATGHAYLHGSIPDITTTHLSFPSGLSAHVFVSWLHPSKQQKLVVVGDRGMAEFDDTRDQDEKLILYPHSVDWKFGQPEPLKGQPEAVPIEAAEPLRKEMEHFLECLQTRKSPKTDGEEGLRVLRVLCEAQRMLDKDLVDSTVRSDSPRGVHGDAMVHDTAIVDDGAVVGAGTRIWHFVHVSPGASIGRDCVIGQGSMVGPRVRIGDRVKIQNNVSVYEGVILEDGVFCGPSCVFTNVLTPRAEVDRRSEFLTTLVARGATIGANATIICGNQIGHHAMVAAGAVVTSDVAPYALVAGTPARQMGWVSEAGERLGEDFRCPRSGEHYELNPEGELVKKHGASAASQGR